MLIQITYHTSLYCTYLISPMTEIVSDIVVLLTEET